MSKHDEVFQRGGVPSVCVKICTYPYAHHVLQEFEQSNRPAYAAAFYEWLENVPDSAATSAWEAACEDGWERLRDAAAEQFGDEARVLQSGHSGGWCEVHGLPDVEEWDDNMHSRWTEFCEVAEDTIKNVPHDIVWHLYFNNFEPVAEKVANQVRGMCE